MQYRVLFKVYVVSYSENNQVGLQFAKCLMFLFASKQVVLKRHCWPTRFCEILFYDYLLLNLFLIIKILLTF